MAANSEMVEENIIANQAKLWNSIYGFSETFVLRCAVELDIATIIHNHGKSMMTLSELVSQLTVKQPVNSDSLSRLMRYLVYIDIFTDTVDVDRETRYGLAPLGKFLVKGSDHCVVEEMLVVTEKEFMAPWQCIKDGITDGSKTAFEKTFGMNIWEYMGKHSEKNTTFNEFMASDSRIMSSELVNKCKDKFQGLNSLVDVGGGTGTTARNIAKAFPSIKCTVYDLPVVLADSPVCPEITQVSGDMFKFVPSADAVLLKYILHDWGDKECIEILKRCKDAVPKDVGKVIIIDTVLDVKSDHPYTKLKLSLDLDMMINTGGKERSEEEWKTLIQAAGFKSYNITQLSALPSVIEAFP